MSVQEAYRLYREGALFVNRKYQRKLVWSVEEKARLIESILKDFPIPLILLAERPRAESVGRYEIIDGLQRLNAIFSFIETAFPVALRFFDVSQFARAKQLADEGIFSIADPQQPRLSPKETAAILDYQLAVTIYAPTEPLEITEVFGRINSGGRLLSDQDKRQAGIETPFAKLVRQLAAKIRGDESRDIVPLAAMPEISIGSRRARQSYGLVADDILWCKQGILRSNQLRESDDEEMIADVAASILAGKPFARSREAFDELYDPASTSARQVESQLATYSAERLTQEIEATFSVLNELLENSGKTGMTIRGIVNPKSTNPVKAAFYAIFMSFFDLIVRQGKKPADEQAILKALEKLQGKMVRSANYAKPEDRAKDIAITTGLIQTFFVHREPAALGHGPALAIDFENSLRRSSIEGARYEFKQGLLRLSSDRSLDRKLLERLVETACAIANVGPDSDGYIYLGVADKQQDAELVRQIDSIEPVIIGQRFVVGIAREAKHLGENIDKYVERLMGAFSSSALSEPLKTQLLARVDVIEYRGLTVIRLTLPKQSAISFVGNQAFVREASKTVNVEGRQLLAVQDLFVSPKPFN
jgi:hypothetical protein